MQGRISDNASERFVESGRTGIDGRENPVLYPDDRPPLLPPYPFPRTPYPDPPYIPPCLHLLRESMRNILLSLSTEEEI